MVNVIPLFKRQTIKNLIIDDDLDMGEYDIKTTDLVVDGIGSFSRDVTINGTTINEGDMNVNQELSVAGLATLQSGLVSNANSTINGDLTVTGTIISPQVLKTNYNISYTNQQGGYHQLPGYSYTAGQLGSVILISMPPNITISGTIRVSNTNSNCYMTFSDINGNNIGGDVQLTYDKVVTVPSGTNQIRVGCPGASGANTSFYKWVIS